MEQIPGSRREFLKQAATGVVGAAIANAWWQHGLFAQDRDATLTQLNRFPRMLQEYYVDRMRVFKAERLKRLEAVQTKADAETYVKSCQDRIRTAFGPHPERTPLKPRITRVIERDGYRIENLIFESRPGFLVTANVYVPTTSAGPFASVVGTCGHSANGKMAEAYQSFAQGLARKGFLCLIYDPIGQGERLQYTGDGEKSQVGAGVQEHLLSGNQQFLVGENLSMWRGWDGIRALDYLLTRKDVDPERIGVTGNSGGGTMSTWLCGLDDRWAMGAPACFVTSFVNNLENELPADTEQCPPHVLALGLDHEDFLAAMAPKPVIILAKEKDYFDVRGSEAAYERLKRLYALLGAEENIGLFVGPTYHGYSIENREAMYGWFSRHTRGPAEQPEPELTIEPEDVLACSPQGQVGPLGSKMIWEYTAETARALAEQRGEVTPEMIAKQLATWMSNRAVPEDPNYRILRLYTRRKHEPANTVTYVVETEPEVQAIVYRLYPERHYSRPTPDADRAILYVSHLSSDAELRENDALRDLMDEHPDVPIYTVDLRGIGESQPNTADEGSRLHHPYGSDYMYAIYGVMLDDAMPLQRTHDLLAVLNWLKAFHPGGVHVMANGWGAIPGTFASLLHPLVTQVTLQHALTSYTDLASAETYHWPLSSMVPDVLQHFDLPDCYRALTSKSLKMIDPWGPDHEFEG